MSPHSSATVVSASSSSHPTREIIAFARALSWQSLSAEVRHSAKRHFLDTLGAMIAGASGEIATQAEAMLASVRPEGKIPVPGRRRRADLLDAAYLAGTAGHGIELDDGYRQGALHPGALIVAALLPSAFERRLDGPTVLTAMVAGFEAMLSIARTVHPDLRKRGFHPTAVVGVFGSTSGAAKLLGANAEQFANALGIAASSAAGLHAYVSGGGDIKRLHAGHAAREGLQSVLLAQQGVAGPPDVIEGKDGFFEAFAFGTQPPARPFTLPPQTGFTILESYFKPYACCRHIQPAAEALFTLLSETGIDTSEIQKIDVETYTLAAEFAHLGFEDFASAQLSFPYVALAAQFRKVDLQHFAADVRGDPQIAALTRKVTVVATEEMDARYPQWRPARVTVVTPRGRFVRETDEALGDPKYPLEDKPLGQKFLDLVSPVIGGGRASELLERLWNLEQEHDISDILSGLAA